MSENLSIYIHHNEYVSFTVVARMIGEYLKPYVDRVILDNKFPIKPKEHKQPDIVIYIHDSIDICLYPHLYYLRGKIGTIAWTDTCLDATLYSSLHPFEGGLHIVTSEFNRKTLSRAGVNVNGVLPRTYNPYISSKVLNENIEKEDYFAVIGSKDETDRKNFKALKKIIEDFPIEVRAITSVDGAWESIPYGSLTEEEKYRFLAKARFLIHLSKAEGFGMPPLEAMSVGTPVIFSDAPAHNSFCVGLPVRISHRETIRYKEPSGKDFFATYYCIDINSGIQQIKRAIRMSPEEYQSMREACLIESQKFRADIVTKNFIKKYMNQFLKLKEGIR